jgi:hypothetical protein
MKGLLIVCIVLTINIYVIISNVHAFTYVFVIVFFLRLCCIRLDMVTSTWILRTREPASWLCGLVDNRGSIASRLTTGCLPMVSTRRQTEGR